MNVLEKFYKTYGSFYGKFTCFKEARKISPIKNIGYNNNETLQRMIDNHKQLLATIRETEYPFFLWINKIFETNKSLNILDLGGALGAHYHNYKKLSLHNNFHWHIYDVPFVTDYVKQNLSSNQLSFHDKLSDIETIDILLASGSIQYIEDFSLKDLPNLPNHLLFARLPLNYTSDTFVTLQNAISSFNPQYVYNRQKFIDNVTLLGYELIDEWKSHYDKCIILNYKEESCHFYSGLYFRKIS